MAIIQQALADGSWLAYVFAFLMGLSMLIYSILDGYDLGVGILSDNASWHEKDRMIASIGPFWDANETWLILGVGILLVAFPKAHGIILTELYIPVALMIFGLIFRGVAFDFRSKSPYQKKWRWNNKFVLGSLLASCSQGYMLGSYITGFNHDIEGIMFSCLIAIALTSAYCLIGACWLIMKCEGDLQMKAVKWARFHLVNSTIGLVSISAVSPMISPEIFYKWFVFPNILALSPIPLMTGIFIIGLYTILGHMPFAKDQYCWLPFTITIGIFLFSFIGMAFSFFPYIIPERMTITEAASAYNSLLIMFYGAIIVLPFLLAYTFLSYYIFRGKAEGLRYD